MNHLKSLSFTAVLKGSANPTLSRRAKLISKLEEQKALAQDPNYLPTTIDAGIQCWHDHCGNTRSSTGCACQQKWQLP